MREHTARSKESIVEKRRGAGHARPDPFPSASLENIVSNCPN